MLPNAENYNPDPAYLRALLDKTLDPDTGKPYSQRKAAKLLGVGERVIRYYMMSADDEGYRPAPYPIQFALECLANGQGEKV
jgi:hypothetical protein